MNQWTFVLAAYLVVVGTTVALVAWSWRSMRRAETEAEAVKRRP